MSRREAVPHIWAGEMTGRADSPVKEIIRYVLTERFSHLLSRNSYEVAHVSWHDVFWRPFTSVDIVESRCTLSLGQTDGCVIPVNSRTISHPSQPSKSGIPNESGKPNEREREREQDVSSERDRREGSNARSEAGASRLHCAHSSTVFWSPRGEGHTQRPRGAEDDCRTAYDEGFLLSRAPDRWGKDLANSSVDIFLPLM